LAIEVQTRIRNNFDNFDGAHHDFKSVVWYLFVPTPPQWFRKW